MRHATYGPRVPRFPEKAKDIQTLFRAWTRNKAVDESVKEIARLRREREHGVPS
jgi:hypothetical protein